MGEQEIDAPRLRGQIVLQHAALGIGRLGLAEQPLEVADIAVDRAAEIGLAIVAAGDLVERRLPLGAVDVTAENATLAGPEALPHVDRGAVVDGTGDLVEPQLAAA